MRTSPGSTVNVKTLRAAVGAARATGLDVAELLRRWEIPRASLEDPDFRFPRHRWAELWQEVESLSGDPWIGLHAAERLPAARRGLWARRLDRVEVSASTRVA